MRLIAVLSLCLVLTTPALAHDHYPAACCTANEDCKPVACAEIEQIGPAAWRHGAATFGTNAVREPIDDRCHACSSGPFGRCIMFPRPKVM